MVDVLPPQYFYDPSFLDYSILMPVWAWIICILMFLGILMLIAMLYIFLIMRPVAGFGKVADTGGITPGDSTMAKGSPTQVFSIWKNRSFIIESLWYYGNILAYSNPLKKMQMWLHSSEKATGISANKPVMITRDGFDGTADFIAEMAVCEIPKIFNDDWGMELIPKKDPEGNPVIDEDGNQVMETVERKDRDGNPYILMSFKDIRARRPILEKLYPDGIPVPIYQLYDLAKIYRFTPQNQDSLKFGGDLIEQAREWMNNNNKEKSGWLERNSLLLLSLMAGIVSMAIVYMVFPVH